MNQSMQSMLRMRGTVGVMQSVHKLYNFNKVGDAATPFSIIRNISLQVNGCARFRSSCIGKVRGFHTTPRNDVHPLIWVVVRPIAKLSAMVVGRGVRKWWSKLPQNKKSLFIQTLNRRKFRILGVTVVIGGVAFIYYESHLQEVPILKRRRFIAFNASQMSELVDFQLKTLMEDYDGQILPASHAHYKRVQNVVDRIINANQDIPEIRKSWLITVVDNPFENAFVLPNGHIFVFQGMLDLCVNDDKLAVILGHEIAHAVLNHAAEHVSYLHMVDFFLIVLVCAIWAVIPTDIVSALVHWLMHKFVYVLMELPNSRQLEMEADEIGLILSAKACFDIRESSAFWANADEMSKADENRKMEWLSTHPSDITRSTVLDEKIPEAISLRLTCKCPPLPPQDPRDRKVVIIQPN